MNKDILIETGALLTTESEKAHFLLSAGGHSDQYVQCEKLNEKPLIRQKIVKYIEAILIASKNTPFWKEIDVIIGGAYGAIKFPDRIGDALFNIFGINPRSIYCERVPDVDIQSNLFSNEMNAAGKDGQCAWVYHCPPIMKSGKFQLRRGFEVNSGEKVLICEDVVLLLALLEKSLNLLKISAV